MTDFEGIVEVNGVKLHVARKGHGPRLLVIHGGPDWDHTYLRAVMEPLQRQAELVFFDIRGCGRSERVPLDELHVSAVAEDARQLMSHFSDESWAILGFSFGGRVGLEVLSRFPEAVDRFILASSSAFPAERKPSLPLTIRDADDVRRWALSSVDENVWRESAREKATEVISEVRFVTGWLDAIRAGATVSYSDRDYSAMLKASRVPLLVLHGEFDRQFPAQEARLLADEIETARAAIIPEAGHFAHMDAPREWNGAIADFITA